SPPLSYPLSLHDALPISAPGRGPVRSTASTVAPYARLESSSRAQRLRSSTRPEPAGHDLVAALHEDLRDVLRGARIRVLRHRHRSEEHTSELQSRSDLVC